MNRVRLGKKKKKESDTKLRIIPTELNDSSSTTNYHEMNPYSDSQYSLVHSKNCLEYFTRGITELFIYLMRFLLPSLILRSSSILPDTFLFSFFSSLLVKWFLLHTFPRTYRFPSVLVLSCLGICILSVFFVLFPLFIRNITHVSMPNSIPISGLYILIVCIRVYNFFPIFCQYRP